MKKISLILMLCILAVVGCSNSNENKSEWVYKGEDGKLVYKKTSNGDQIMDFSHAGYMGGGVSIPDVPVKKRVSPSGGGDDAGIIQAAIDEVAKLPLVDGFRGTVLLEPGIFISAKAININVSGIVLRGSGVDKTTIKMVGDNHFAVVVGETNEKDEMKKDAEYETMISDNYVASGTSKFNVADASGFSVGDIIEIKRPITDAWVKFMNMHNLKRDGTAQTWLSTTRSGITVRKITEISGNKLTLNIPLSDSYDAKYLNPPGTTITKISPLPRVTQVGVENLHVQCEPIAIEFTEAPYRGVNLRGDDCWIRNVFFEETISTTVLAGNRITVQNVVVFHTHPNLGAAKPADFSIGGSQILIDRCEATGGNTYFVWTSNLHSGPNVVLNCTFRGHGNRIQPHARWSTGMLVDNCSIPDGGIDFLNRGVAGTGHGWTMGWAVAWNSIAKTYVIQQPSGVYNWAIGNIGERVKTARLFDTAPIEPEGEFESHGNPVSLQSLYLAQLEERLGIQALKNIGYSSNSIEMFTNKSVSLFPPLAKDDDPVFGADLALHRPVSATSIKDNSREKFGPERALDADRKTYWAAEEKDLPAVFIADTEGPIDINTIIIEEADNFLNRVKEYKVEGQINSDWKLLSQGTTIGQRKVDQFQKETVWKVKLTILKSDGAPAIRKFGFYLK